jgi:hypothetical protein
MASLHVMSNSERVRDGRSESSAALRCGAPLTGAAQLCETVDDDR